MTTPLASPIRLQQRDGETIKIGPIPSTAGGYYDATGHAARLVVKANRFAADATGTTITGTLAGDTTVGFTATFVVPDAVTATAGQLWAHAWVTPSGGKPQTIRQSALHVEAT